MVRVRWGNPRKKNNEDNGRGYDDVFGSVFRPIESKRKVVSDDVVVDPDPAAWLNNSNRIHGIGGLIVKPCHMTGFCPYGQLVEAFPLRENRDYFSCNLFGHDCPVFYHAESVTENDIDGVIKDFNSNDTFDSVDDDDSDVFLDGKEESDMVEESLSSPTPTDNFKVDPPVYDDVINDIDNLLDKKKK